MSKKLQAILLALGLSVVIFGVGCSSDDDDDEPTPPTVAERLVGDWWAIDAGPQLGSDSVKLVFRSSGTFHYEEYFTLLDAYTTWDGDYTADDNSITFMVDMIDSAAADTTITWDGELHGADDDTLHLEHYYGTGTPTAVTYVNVTAPIN